MPGLTVPFEHSASPVEPTPLSQIPPLENGDRLSRPEFERRWDAMPQLKRAELIDGVVYMGSPVGHANHGKPHVDAIGWLTLYLYATPGIQAGLESSIRLDLENMPQPDAFLYIPHEPRRANSRR